MYFALEEIWISLFHLIVTYRKNNHCFLLSFWFTTTGQLRKSSMSFCHLCGLVHPLRRPPAPMTKVNAALEYVSWHGVAWILIFYNSRLHQFEPAQLGEWWCHRKTTGGASAPGVRGLGASPLPPGEGRASWGRSGDQTSLCNYACWQFDTDCSRFISVYANDVVLSIQRSQMLICVLSADYLSNTNAVFILESGIQVDEFLNWLYVEWGCCSEYKTIEIVNFSD